MTTEPDVGSGFSRLRDVGSGFSRASRDVEESEDAECHHRNVGSGFSRTWRVWRKQGTPSVIAESAEGRGLELPGRTDVTDATIAFAHIP
jgi:hypothetical protein